MSSRCHRANGRPPIRSPYQLRSRDYHKERSKLLYPGYLLYHKIADFEKFIPYSQSQLASCKKYYPRMYSVCDDDDEFCAQGGSLTVHLSYMTKYATPATNFIVNAINKYSVPIPASTVKSPPKATPTGATSTGAKKGSNGKKTTSTGTNTD
jgi:Cutinase